MQNTIYYLTLENILDKNILSNDILSDLTTNYYYSDDFSEEFYIELAKNGFISTTTMYNDTLYLLPEIQFEYAILDFKDLIINKKIKKLLQENNFIFTQNQRFKEVLDKLDDFHNPNWLTGEYKNLMISLFELNNINFELKSFELICKDTNELVAGEIGYVINNIYTSLTGFSSREKKYNNFGKLQLVLLSKYLEEKDYAFWNLGHPYMQYKFDLGAKVYSREEFFKRWFSNDLEAE